MSFTRHILRLSIPLVLAASAAAQDAVVPVDFPTIQAAVNGATDTNGDGRVHILVLPGTYTENVSIQDRPNRLLQGSGPMNTTISGAGVLDTVEVRRSPRVVVRGFSITNTGTGDGLEFGGSDFGLVENNVLFGNQDGISINRSSDCLVRNNSSRGNLEEGIKIHRSIDTTVEGNTANNNRTGIDNDLSRRTVVRMNITAGNQSQGIRDRRGGSSLLEQNSSTSNGSNGFLVRETSRSTLSANTASGNAENGLRMRDTADSLVTMNQLVNNNEWGIRRRNGSNDDFSSAPGIQRPPGDNNLSGNGNGPLRND